MSSCQKDGCCKGSIKVNEPLATEDDDVWADSDDEQYHHVMMDKSTADLKRVHTKQGYLDGLTRAQESSLQHGFDVAFPHGAQLGIEVGRLLAQLYCHCKSHPQLFEDAQTELNITNVLSKEYFDRDLELRGPHPVIRKWQDRLVKISAKET